MSHTIAGIWLHNIFYKLDGPWILQELTEEAFDYFQHRSRNSGFSTTFRFMLSGMERRMRLSNKN